MKGEKIVIFSVFIIMLFLLGLWLIKTNPLLLWDENVFLGNARSHVSISNFTEDFRFPLLEYIIASVWFFTGESVFSARILSVFFYLLSVLTFYLIMNLLFNKEKKVILFSTLFAITPVMLYWSFRIYADILSMALSLLAIYFLIRYEQSKNKHVFIILAGFFSSMAFLSRFALAILIFSIFIYLIVKKDKIGLLLFTISSFLSILPWLVYNWFNYGNILWDLLYYQQGINMWTTWQPIWKEIINIASSLNFILILLIPGIFFFVKKIVTEIKKRKFTIFSFLFLYLGLSLVYYTFFVNLKDERYIIIMLPFFLIISFLGLKYTEKRISFLRGKIKRIFSIILIFLLLFSFIFLINMDIFRFHSNSACQKENALFHSIDYIEKNLLLSKGDIIISNYWPHYAYYFNVKAYAIWGSNLDEKIKEYNPKLVILKEHDGTSYDEASFNKSTNLVLLQNFSDKCDNKIKIYTINISTSSFS